MANSATDQAEQQRFYISVPTPRAAACFGLEMTDTGFAPFGYPGVSLSGDNSYFADFQGPLLMQSQSSFIGMQASKTISFLSNKAVLISTNDGDYPTVPPFGGDLAVGVMDPSSEITAWAGGTSYTIGQIVTSSGNLYAATSTGTSGGTAPSGTATPSDGTITWTYLSTPWVAKTAYAQGEVVQSNANLYRASAAGTSGTTAPSGTTSCNDGSVAWTCVTPSGGSYLTAQMNDLAAMGLTAATLGLVLPRVGAIMHPMGLAAGKAFHAWMETKLILGVGLEILEMGRGFSADVMSEVSASKFVKDPVGNLGGIWLHTEDHGGINMFTRGAFTSYAQGDHVFIGSGGDPGSAELPANFRVVMPGWVSAQGTLGVDLFSPCTTTVAGGVAADLMARGPVGIASCWGPVNVAGATIRLGYAGPSEFKSNAPGYLLFGQPMSTRNVQVQAWDKIELQAGSVPPVADVSEGVVLDTVVNVAAGIGTWLLDKFSAEDKAYAWNPPESTPGSVLVSAVKARVTDDEKPGPGEVRVFADSGIKLAAGLTPTKTLGNNSIELEAGDFSIKISADNGISITQKNGPAVTVTKDGVDLKLNTVEVKLDKDGLAVSAGGNELKVASTGVTINKKAIVVQS
jgi:hypothetical protein